MNKGTSLLLGISLSLFVSHGPTVAASAERLSTTEPSVYSSLMPQRGGINGHVFGASRKPVADIYIELRDDNGTTLTRAKTDASGRFEFTGLPDGRYVVLVLPYGTDYMEQSQEVTLTTVSFNPRGDVGTARSGGDIQQVDFTLKVKDSVALGPFAIPSATVYAQNVPDEARKSYEKGVSFLRDKKEKEGFEELKHALELFPNYFAALDRLGTEYAARGLNEAAAILLTKAVEINPRSFSSTFGLGLAQYNLGRNADALGNLQKAVNLYAKSLNAYLYLAMALKKAGKPAEAEAAFKKANDLGGGKIAEVHWQLARFYSEQKRYKEAADELEVFLKVQPDSRDADKIKQIIQQLRAKAASS